MVICQPPLEMGEEIEFENVPKWSNFRLSWAPDLDLGSGHGHYLFHLSSSTTCIPNFIEIEETFCGRTDGNLPPIVLGRLPKFGSRPKNDGWTAVRGGKEGQTSPQRPHRYFLCLLFLHRAGQQ